MESCELHLILQPFRLREMSSYALNCTGIKDGNVTPMSLLLHPENYQTAMSQDIEHYFNFELIHSLTFMASSYYLLPITTK